MKKGILTIAFMLFGIASFNAKADIKFGLRAEANMIHVGFSRADLDPINFQGFSIGPAVEFRLPVISVEGALLYSQQNLSFSDLEEEGFKGLTTDRAKLIVPVMLKYSFGLSDLASLYVGAGPDISFKLKGPDLKSMASAVSDDYKEKNFAAGIDIGAGVLLLSHFQVGANFRWGLVDEYSTFKASDLTDTKSLTGKPKTFSLTATYFF